jgi:hypothetical protein
MTKIKQRKSLNSLIKMKMKSLQRKKINKTTKRKKLSSKGRKTGRNMKRLTTMILSLRLMTLLKMKSLSHLRKTRNLRLKPRLMRSHKDLVWEQD